MGSPLQLSKLSRATLILLGGLVGANLLLFLLLSSTPEQVRPAAEGAASDSDLPGRRLTLIEELDEQRLQAMARNREGAEDRPLPQILPAAAEQPLACRAWGPFTNSEMLEAVRVQVESVGEVVEIQPGEIESPPDFLVYLDSDSNLDNARRILKELESQSIDAYVIAGGEYVNSVSAGVFSNRQRADEQLARLSDLGYQPMLEPLQRIQTVSYLITRVPEAFEVAGQEYLECGEIASAQ